MPNVCRIGDQGVGICYQHKSPTPFTTTFITGAPTVDNQQQVVTVGCLGITTCGHVTMATVGSSTVDAEGSLVHRIGDAGIVLGGGHYVAVSGSPDVFAGD